MQIIAVIFINLPQSVIFLSVICYFTQLTSICLNQICCQVHIFFQIDYTIRDIIPYAAQLLILVNYTRLFIFYIGYICRMEHLDLSTI